MTRSDNEPNDQLFVYFVALELWPWSHAWPWSLYVMYLGRHGQLASLILVTFHVFDSVFNPIFLFVYPVLWIFIIWTSFFGWHTCTVCLWLNCVPFTLLILMKPSGPRGLCHSSWPGLVWVHLLCFCFGEQGAGDRKIQQGRFDSSSCGLFENQCVTFFWCLSLCLSLSVSLSLCCHLSFRMKGLGIVQRFTVFSSLKWHLL